MVRRLHVRRLERVQTELSYTVLKEVYCLDGVRKAIKILSEDSLSLGLDSILTSLMYEAGVLTT
jgi:hypothetical protein